MGNDDLLSKVIDEAGFSGSEILARANDPKIKADLRTRTQEAKDTGICGVPSYRVFRRKTGDDWKFDGDIVWGQDELAVVEDLIAGWDGQEVADVGREAEPGLVSKL